MSYKMSNLSMLSSFCVPVIQLKISLSYVFFTYFESWSRYGDQPPIFLLGSFTDNVNVKSGDKDDEHQESNSHKAKPGKVSLLVSGSVNPSDVPEVVASDRDQSGSESSQQTEGGELNETL